MDAKTLAGISIFISVAMLAIALFNYMENKKLREASEHGAHKCSCDKCTGTPVTTTNNATANPGTYTVMA